MLSLIKNTIGCLLQACASSSIDLLGNSVVKNALWLKQEEYSYLAHHQSESHVMRLHLGRSECIVAVPLAVLHVFICINVNVEYYFIISLNFTAATYQLICTPDLMIWYLSFPELVLSHEVLFRAL